MKNIILWILLIFLAIYFGFGVLLFIDQADYIYYPDRADFKNCPAFDNAKKISSGSARGYFTKRSSEKIIVYYHGNAGRACDRAYLDSFFGQQNYSTLFVEYTGYAESAGNSSMKDLLANVTDTIAFLKTQNFKNIVVAGESLGVGPASYHAINAGISKLILITAYNNFADVASAHYPFYPMHLLLLNNFTPDAWLAHYTGAVSVILAEQDAVIPNKLGRKLYGEIPSSAKAFYVIKDSGHNSIYEKDEFYNVLKFILTP